MPSVSRLAALPMVLLPRRMVGVAKGFARTNAFAVQILRYRATGV